MSHERHPSHSNEDVDAAADNTDAGPFQKEEITRVRQYKEARMPVERYAREYKMTHKNRGMAIIFNHEHYVKHLLQTTREGTKKDCDDLKEILEQLEFQVSVHNDYSTSEIHHTVENASQTDHTNSDCIMIVILSHGENNILYAQDNIYKLDTIVQYFTPDKCPTLAGKPKIFIVQACRGDSLDNGIQMCSMNTETDGESNSIMKYTIPLHADFLYAFSTIPGFYSWRNKTDGTWFIQALVKELKENGRKENILTLLTYVCQRVAIDYESYLPDKPYMHGQKQIPCITSMLTRILHFPEK